MSRSVWIFTSLFTFCAPLFALELPKNSLAFQNARPQKRSQSLGALLQLKSAQVEALHALGHNSREDFGTRREQALLILTPVQRAQLQTFPNDARFNLRKDALWQLLMMPTEKSGQFASDVNETTPRPFQSKRAHSDQNLRGAKGSGRYGVYGGYGYGGAQYGVYGSYGQGPVGVHVGIGRGGPHFGIGVGGGFGWGR